jgi:hypothetical protein
VDDIKVGEGPVTAVLDFEAPELDALRLTGIFSVLFLDPAAAVWFCGWTELVRTP